MSKELAQLNFLKDLTNPRSVANITPSSVSNALKFIPDSVFEMPDDELRETAGCTVVEERLRISFWLEYDKAQEAGRNMSLANVYGGICGQPYFLKKVVGNSFKLAYVLTPPLNYQIQTSELLDLGLRQLRDILNFPHLKKDGTIDSRLADVKYRIVMDLHMRVKGAVPYRTENIHLHASQPSIKKPDAPIDMKALDERIKQLESEANGQVIEIEAKSADDSPGEG